MPLLKGNGSLKGFTVTGWSGRKSKKSIAYAIDEKSGSLTVTVEGAGRDDVSVGELLEFLARNKVVKSACHWVCAEAGDSEGSWWDDGEDLFTTVSFRRRFVGE